MADVDNGTSGLAVNTKKGRSKRGRGKKNYKESVSNYIDDQLTCQTCSEVYKDPNDKLLECERYENWYCTGCLEMSDDVYDLMVARKDLHWFCTECEKPAISAVKTNKEIEEKCAAYMNSITGKIENIEKKLDSKAEKSEVDGLEVRVRDLETKGTVGVQSETVVVDLEARVKGLESKGAEGHSAEAQSDTVRETIAEQREREFRKRNIVVQNLEESKKTEVGERKVDDIELVKELFSAVGLTTRKY